MRMSRRLALYGMGGTVLYNLYNNGTVADEIGGFTKTTSAGTLTMESTTIKIGQSTAKLFCLAQTNLPIKVDKVRGVTASVVISAGQQALSAYLGYSTKAGVTALDDLDGYVTVNNDQDSTLLIDLSSVTGKIYIYIGYQCTSGGQSSARYASFMDISTIVDAGVTVSGELYNAGVVNGKIEAFVRSGARPITSVVTYNSDGMMVTSNSSNAGVFVRSKYPVKMDDLASITWVGSKNQGNNSVVAHFGYDVSGSIISNGYLDGKVSFTSGTSFNMTLDVADVTGYAYIYFGLQPTSGGYSTPPELTITKITAATKTEELADTEAALMMLGVNVDA